MKWEREREFMNEECEFVNMDIFCSPTHTTFTLFSPLTGIILLTCNSFFFFLWWRRWGWDKISLREREELSKFYYKDKKSVSWLFFLSTYILLPVVPFFLPAIFPHEHTLTRVKSVLSERVLLLLYTVLHILLTASGEERESLNVPKERLYNVIVI